jgi:hypothetical protein
MNPDMISMKGSDKEALTRIPAAQVPNYHEGPWVFFRNGIYYLMYPGAATTVDSKRSDRMLYSTATSVHGPWTYRGYVLNPVNTGDTSHGSVVEFKGRWFMFYHNSEVYSSSAANTTGNLRSAAVDELFFNEDGTIQMVQQTVSGPAKISNPLVETPKTSYHYPATAAVLAGGVTLSTRTGWDDGQVLGAITSATSTATFNNVQGGVNGGRGTISIRYSTSSATRRSLKIIVNGYDWGYINLYGNNGVYDRDAEFTVTNLKPGTTNTVQLVGRQTGEFYVARVSVTPFEDAPIVGKSEISGITVTTPLAYGYPAKVKFQVSGTNLEGKKVNAYLFGLTAEATGTSANVASGTIDVPASIWSNAAYQVTKDPKTFSLGVSVAGEKTSRSASVTVLPIPARIWDVYTENAGGKLQLKFNEDISKSNVTVKVGNAVVNAAVTADNKVLTNVDFDSVGDYTPIEISGIKFPMFLDYGFVFNTNKLNVEPPPPPITYYSSQAATVGNNASRNQNGASPTGWVIENMHNSNAYAQWANVDGKEKGGKFLLGIYYGSSDVSGSFNVTVNGTSAGYISWTGSGGWTTFTGYAELVLTQDLTPGATNTIRLSNRAGGANMYQISLTPIAD